MFALLQWYNKQTGQLIQKAVLQANIVHIEPDHDLYNDFLVVHFAGGKRARVVHVFLNRPTNVVPSMGVLQAEQPLEWICPDGLD